MVTLILLGITVFPVNAGDQPSSFTLEMHDSLVDLAAEDVPLREILKAISRKCGLTLRSADQATELISCRLHSVTLAEGLEKLLDHWNYALLYTKDSQGHSVPDTLWVINRNPHRMSADAADDNPPRLARIEEKEHPPQDHLKKYKKQDIAAVFSNSKKVLLDIDAKSIDAAGLIDAEPSPLIEDEQQRCIKITRLSGPSPLTEIGLQEGDLIMNVNGNPVGSAADLVQLLSTQPDSDVSVIRIERLRDGKIDPIYLELQ
ncbi:MAG: PDZ domain-containing protein [Proteobacteria bacterium]|nr:PDZ domain-containing protein [Pseudomonadota bacterium]MBU4297384.1 PDZ domain-containing protein [Pseudomonadota bacterium]MCG2748728.1 PDZ domain-containing protein [Desulfobulbaceae bacterium]